MGLISSCSCGKKCLGNRTAKKTQFTKNQTFVNIDQCKTPENDNFLSEDLEKTQENYYPAIPSDGNIFYLSDSINQPLRYFTVISVDQNLNKPITFVASELQNHRAHKNQESLLYFNKIDLDLTEEAHRMIGNILNNSESLRAYGEDLNKLLEKQRIFTDVKAREFINDVKTSQKEEQFANKILNVVVKGIIENYRCAKLKTVDTKLDKLPKISQFCGKEIKNIGKSLNIERCIITVNMEKIDSCVDKILSHFKKWDIEGEGMLVIINDFMLKDGAIEGTIVVKDAIGNVLEGMNSLMEHFTYKLELIKLENQYKSTESIGIEKLEDALQTQMINYEKLELDKKEHNTKKHYGSVNKEVSTVCNVSNVKEEVQNGGMVQGQCPITSSIDNLNEDSKIVDKGMDGITYDTIEESLQSKIDVKLSSKCIGLEKNVQGIELTNESTPRSSSIFSNNIYESQINPLINDCTKAETNSRVITLEDSQIHTSCSSNVSTLIRNDLYIDDFGVEFTVEVLNIGDWIYFLLLQLQYMECRTDALLWSFEFEKNDPMKHLSSRDNIYIGDQICQRENNSNSTPIQSQLMFDEFCSKSNLELIGERLRKQNELLLIRSSSVRMKHENRQKIIDLKYRLKGLRSRGARCFVRNTD